MRMRRHPPRRRFRTDGDAVLAFYLAELLGRTVRELEQTMSAREFFQWRAYLAVKREREELAMREAARSSR
jgi:hypothetical protein